MRSATGSIGAALISIALAGTGPEAFALAFGRNASSSHLGQTLDFSVMLRFDGGEFVASDCVVAEVISGEERVPAANVRVSMDALRETGERLLHVRTTSPIDEPVVHVNLSVGCPATMSRSFVAFVDPPTMNLAQAPAPLTAAAPPPAAPVPSPAASAADSAASAPPPAREDFPPQPAIRIARPSAPPVRRAQPPAEAASEAPAVPRRQRPVRTAVRPSESELAQAPLPSEVSPAAPRASEPAPKAAAAARPPRGPRLQLEAPPLLQEPVAAASAARPAARAASVMAAAASAARPPVAASAARPAASAVAAAASALAAPASAPASAVATANAASAPRRPVAASAAASTLAAGTGAPAAAAGASAINAAATASAPKAVAAALAASAAAAKAAGKAAPAPITVQAAGPAASGRTLAAGAAAAPLSDEQARWRSIEETLNKLRADGEATRGTVATLQTRLLEAEAARDQSQPLVRWLLAMVVILLLLLAGLLLWMRRRERKRDEWWLASLAKAAPNALPPGARAPIRPSGFDPVLDSELTPEEADAAARLALASAFGDAPQSPSPNPPAPQAPRPLAWKPTLPIPELDSRHAAQPEVSAEELLDLEQQAEFFVTLGQDDAAMELLFAHVHRLGSGASALPWLKLLQILQRSGDRATTERVRGEFQALFGALPPGWNDAGATAGHALQDNPGAMARVQESWPTPERAMRAIEQLLYRRGGDAAAFDLAAYQELLFLYEIARDLAGHADRHVTVVDFELPLGQDPADALSVTQPLRASPAPAGRAGTERPVRVDVDLDLGP